MSERRDVKAAKRYFRRVMRRHGPPQKITLDGYQASHRGVADLKEERRIPQTTEVRSCAYRNNIIEQDHGRVKSRTGPMLGFKRFLAHPSARSYVQSEKLVNGEPKTEEPAMKLYGGIDLPSNNSVKALLDDDIPAALAERAGGCSQRA